MKDFKIFYIDSVLIVIGQCPYCHAKQDIAVDSDEYDGEEIVEECEQCNKEFIIDIDGFEDEESDGSDEEE
jgi:hypothetical protein